MAGTCREASRPQAWRSKAGRWKSITRDIDVPADPARALNLDTGEAIRPSQSSLDGMAYRLTTPEGSSNPIFLAFTNHPILVEKEPNNDRASAQRLPIPCDVTGSFAAVGDKDFYSFLAKKGEKLVIEIFGERQSGLIDPLVTGFDSKDKRIFTGDNGSGRNIGQIRYTTNTRDVRWEFTPPADGEYVVQVRDHYYQQRGSLRFTYRLCIRRPQPDFRLIVVPNHETQPDAAVIGRGGRHWMDVLAFRNDGFDEPIHVQAADLPPGVTCDPIVIGPGKTSAPLVFLRRQGCTAGPCRDSRRGQGDACQRLGAWTSHGLPAAAASPGRRSIPPASPAWPAASSLRSATRSRSLSRPRRAP